MTKGKEVINGNIRVLSYSFMVRAIASGSIKKMKRRERITMRYERGGAEKKED